MDTETETKEKALLLFGYLIRKPQSFVLEAVFIYGVHSPIDDLTSARKNHSKTISTCQAFKLRRTHSDFKVSGGRDGYTRQLHEKMFFFFIIYLFVYNGLLKYFPLFQIFSRD